MNLYSTLRPSIYRAQTGWHTSSRKKILKTFPPNSIGSLRYTSSIETLAATAAFSSSRRMMTQKLSKPQSLDKSRSASRHMMRVELQGKHLHETEKGVTVAIYSRQERFLARGRIHGRAFGRTLGADLKVAERELRHLLVAIDNGSFQRASETRGMPIATHSVPRLTFRELCARFLAEKKRILGIKSTATYRSRLAPAMEFAELPESLQRWPLAACIDREFAIGLNSFLQQRLTTRNGRPNGAQKPMSGTQIKNVVECTITMLNWAKRPEVNNLPAHFVLPFDKQFTGRRTAKDPLAENPLTLNARIRLVQLMDRWQLVLFAIPFTLPLRPDEYTALLISDVDFAQRHLLCATKFGGREFNKGKQNFRVPFPPSLESLLRHCGKGRPAGPLLLRRSKIERPPSIPAGSQSDDKIREAFFNLLANSPDGPSSTQNDAKRRYRALLHELGGVTSSQIYKEFQVLRKSAGLPTGIRPYDLRGAVSTDLQNAGVSHLVQRYVTGHTTADILNAYVSLKSSLRMDMERYFTFIEPLLAAIQHQSMLLGICSEMAA